jgi:hypothetical protein
VRAREILAKAEDSPERQEALRLLADRLDLPRETMAGIAPARGVHRGGEQAQPQKLLDAGERLERDVLAAAMAHPELVQGLAELSPDHFDHDLHRRVQAQLTSGEGDDPELVGLRAELDARAGREGITKQRGTELLLRIRERKLRRDLQGEGDLARVTELQAHLVRINQALTELA